ncbi:MAG: carboxylating nicotinate-nucleotide diphosphorylase [Bacteroidetes bacterium]|nr:carboxylating nicotinate-nucleotide diphosphorylase [Bacteroidota bacterium]
MIKYKQITQIEPYILEKNIDQWLDEDKAEIDMTTRYCVPNKSICNAIIEAENECVFVGEQVINYIFKKCKINIKVKDGDIVKKNEIIAEINGKSKYILSRERVMLNIIQRLSGIATTTKQYVDIAKPYNVQILDTRKTTPGMRHFEKYAVYAGGGTNHRFDLASAILIKDNHIVAGGSIENVIKNVNEKNKYNLQIELEIDNIEQLKNALKLGVKGFLLDNMPPDEIKKCVELIRNSNDDGEDIFIEASGGITLENLPKYLTTGINAISIGALTHRIVSADIHLNFTHSTLVSAST